MQELRTKLTADATDFLGIVDKSLERAGAAVARFEAGKGKVDLDVDASKATAGLKELNSTAGASGGVLGRLGGIAAGVAAAGFAALAGGFVAVVSAGSEFGKKAAELEAITGVTGAGLEDLKGKARSLAVEFGGSAAGNIEAFKGILSRLGPDIAKSPPALESMTRAVNTLSAATGDDAAASMDALTTGLLQFQVSLDDPVAAAAEMTKQMNVMAAGAKEGAAEVPQVAEAIKVAGVAMNGANISFEETNAQIQALAAGGKVGAEAGTAIRNVWGKIGEGRFLPKDVQDELKAAGVNMDVLGNTSLSATTRLRELQKIQKDSALVTKLFGTENAAAANILLRSTDAIDELTTKITGTQTAFEQAAVNQRSFAFQFEQFKATLADFAIGAFEAIGPALAGGLKIGADALKGMAAVLGEVVGFIGENAAAFGLFAAAIAAMAISAKAAAISTTILGVAQKAQALVTKVVTAAQLLWNAAMSANPIGLVIAGVAALVGGLLLLKNALETTRGEQLEQADAEQELVQMQIRSNKERQTQVRSIAGLASEYERLGSKANRTAAEEKKLGEIQLQINATYPGLIKSTNSFAENLSAVNLAAIKSVDELRKLNNEMVALEKQSRAIAIRQARLISQEAIQATANAVQDALGGLFTGPGTALKIRQLNQGLADAIIAAKDEPALQRAINDFNQKIQQLGQTGEIERTAELEITRKANEIFQARKALLDLLKGPVAGPGEVAVEPVVETRPPAGPPPEEVKRGVLNLTSDLEKIRGDATKREQEARLAAIKETQEKERELLESKFNTERDTALREQRETLAKLAENARKEKPDTLTLDVKDETGKVLRTLTARADIETEIATQTTRRLAAIEAQRLAERTELAEKFAQEASKREREATQKEIDALRNREAAITGETADALEARFQLHREARARERTLLDTPEALAAFDAATAQQNAEREAAITARARAERIAAIKDAGERELAIRIDDMLQQHDVILSNEQTTQDERTQILRLATQQQLAIEREHYAQTNGLVAAAGKFADSVGEQVLAAFRRRNQEQSATETDKHKQSLQLLRESLAREEITRAEFLAKQAELERNFAGERQTLYQNTSDFIIASNEVIAGVMSGIATELADTNAALFAKFAEGTAPFSEVLVGAATQFGAIVLEAAVSQQNIALAAAEAAARIAFDFLDKMIPVWSAQILGFSLSSAESVASFGAAGVAKWLLLTGLMKAALAAARGALGLREGTPWIEARPGRRGPDRAGVYALDYGERVVPRRDNLRDWDIYEGLRRGKPDMALSAFMRQYYPGAAALHPMQTAATTRAAADLSPLIQTVGQLVKVNQQQHLRLLAIESSNAAIAKSNRKMASAVAAPQEAPW